MPFVIKKKVNEVNVRDPYLQRSGITEKRWGPLAVWDIAIRREFMYVGPGASPIISFMTAFCNEALLRWLIYRHRCKVNELLKFWELYGLDLRTSQTKMCRIFLFVITQ